LSTGKKKYAILEKYSWLPKQNQSEEKLG